CLTRRVLRVTGQHPKALGLRRGGESPPRDARRARRRSMATSEPVVLIVEDDPDALLLLQRALSKARLSLPVRIAVDGDQAVKVLSGQDPVPTPLPCLVLLDLKLPKRSGLEVLEWMRNRPGLRRIPVIVV